MSDNSEDLVGLHIARYDVLGVPVSAVTLEISSRVIREWAKDKVGRFICVRDVHGVMLAEKNPELIDIHRHAAMVTPDGMPLVWLGKWKGQKVERTCGPDLMERLLTDSKSGNLKHFFYGSQPGVAQRLKETFIDRFPQIQIVGAETPPYTPLAQPALLKLAQQINESQADITWIGLSTPKQEYLMRDLVKYVDSTLIGVGAAFDFLSGSVTRAPKWMQYSGLEWSFRLVSEPRRLWRRYLVLAPKFVWKLLFK